MSVLDSTYGYMSYKTTHLLLLIEKIEPVYYNITDDIEQYVFLRDDIFKTNCSLLDPAMRFYGSENITNSVLLTYPISNSS